MSILNLISEIGEDADLLARSDEWLEQERKATAAELDRKAQELRALLLAQRIKRLLQQRNLVAVQQILRTADGEVRDIIIKIMNLPDALAILDHRHDTLDEANTAAQILTWNRDGYDVATSAALRTG
jgi:hypothetical protein